MVTFAAWPSSTFGMSVSSTSTSASMTDMSAMVSSIVPALFIVPTTAVSPSSMFRRVTRPSIGDEMITWFMLYRVVDRLAFSCLICSWRVWMSCSRARSSAWRTATSFCARSRDSLVVSPSFHSSS